MRISMKIDVEQVLRIFKYKDGRLYWNVKRGGLNIGDEAGCISRSEKYSSWKIRVNGVKFRRSRIVWCIHFGEIPEGMEIDHINHNPLDDRIENLRLATTAQNAANKTRRKPTSLGLPKGVTVAGSGRYCAGAMVNGKRIHFGVFDTVDEASESYRINARMMFGEFFSGT